MRILADENVHMDIIHRLRQNLLKPQLKENLNISGCTYMWGITY